MRPSPHWRVQIAGAVTGRCQASHGRTSCVVVASTSLYSSLSTQYCSVTRSKSSMPAVIGCVLPELRDVHRVRDVVVGLLAGALGADPCRRGGRTGRRSCAGSRRCCGTSRRCRRASRPCPVPFSTARCRPGELLLLDRGHRVDLHDEIDRVHVVGVGVDGGPSSTRTSKPLLLEERDEESVVSTGWWPSQPPRTMRALRLVSASCAARHPSSVVVCDAGCRCGARSTACQHPLHLQAVGERRLAAARPAAMSTTKSRTWCEKACS